jgi:hypothetical protein
MEQQPRVTRTERGWAGHFICAHDCKFRRNTLLTLGDIKIVVSTVGLYERSGTTTEIGYNRYFETMAFHADPTDTRYHDADITKQISFESDWAISDPDADDRANDMHEAVVAEITAGLLQGLKYPGYRDDEETD